jgi:hypothetical protein
MPVVFPRSDPARHHQQDRATPKAAVSPALNHNDRRCGVSLRWPANLPLAQTMAVHPQRMSNRPAC